MKKKISCLACLLLFCIYSSACYAKDNMYVSLSAGISHVIDSDIDESGSPKMTASLGNGPAGSFAIGYDYKPVRFEIEADFQKNDIDSLNALGSKIDTKGSISSTATMVNLYYDAKNDESPVFVYGLIGVGLCYVSLDDFGVDDKYGYPFSYDGDDTVFAYQIGFGLGFDITKTVILDLKYKFFGTTKPSFEGTEVEYQSNNVYAGIRINL